MSLLLTGLPAAVTVKHVRRCVIDDDEHDGYSEHIAWLDIDKPGQWLSSPKYTRASPVFIPPAYTVPRVPATRSRPPGRTGT